MLKHSFSSRCIRRLQRLGLILSLSCPALCVVPATAADPDSVSTAPGDWARWRGPNVDGLSKESGLLKEWPKEGPPLAWRSKGLGRGFASVSVVGDRLYTMGEKDGGCQLIALNRADGSVVWQAKFGGGDPNCTPTVAGDMVYGLSRDGVLAGLKTSDGTVVWQHDFKSEFGGKVPVWGFSESPLVDGDLVIASPGGNDAFIAAFNRQTGSIVWKTPLPSDTKFKGHGGAGYSSPVIFNAGNVKQYVTLTGHGVFSVNAETGELLWTYDRVANGTANIPTPIIQGNTVLCSSGYGDGGTALLEIKRQGEKFNVDEKYYFEAKALQNHHGGMIFWMDLSTWAMVQQRLPVCFNLNSGKDAWRPGRGVGSGSAAVAYADGHLYFRYQDAKMALIEATPKEYRLKGKFPNRCEERRKLAASCDRRRDAVPPRPRRAIGVRHPREVNLSSISLSHYTAHFVLRPLVGESSASEERAIISFASWPNRAIVFAPTAISALSHYTAHFALRPLVRESSFSEERAISSLRDDQTERLIVAPPHSFHSPTTQPILHCSR